MKRVATYVRVSTSQGQTTDNQTRELRAACVQRGWTITHEFADNGISPDPKYFDLYRSIAMGVLSAAAHERSADGERALKDMMFRWAGGPHRHHAGFIRKHYLLHISPDMSQGSSNFRVFYMLPGSSGCPWL